MLKMNHFTNKRFLLLCSSATGLLLFDYFLFSTGNPSITYSVLGGWFEVPLLAAFAITLYFGYNCLKRREKWLFVLHAALVIVLSSVLLLASPLARQLASNRLEARTDSFIKDPLNPQIEVSNEERQLMTEILTQKFSIRRTAFIPTFQRTDYVIQTEQGAMYLLVVESRWNGKPMISLRRED